MQLIKLEIMLGVDFRVITTALVTMPRQPKEEVKPSIALYKARLVADVEPLAISNLVSETKLRTL
jgi:hypothetical protein